MSGDDAAAMRGQEAHESAAGDAPDARAIATEVVTTTEAFLALAPVWDEVVSATAAPNVFLTWAWLSSWWECFGTGTPWVVVVRARDTGRVVGLAPFLYRQMPRSGPALSRELAFMGCTVGSPDHLDVVARVGWEAAVADAVVRCVLERRPRWDLLRLDGMAAQSRLVEQLLDRRRRWPSLVWEVPCPWVALPPGWDDYVAGLKRKVRYNLRSRAHRLERESEQPVRFEMVARPEELPGALEALFALHQGRRETDEPGAFGDASKVRFHQLVAERFLRAGGLRLSLLKVGDQTLAAAYCLRVGDVVSFYQTGFDPDWSKYGPGAAIVAYAIESAIREGAREFDFLRGDHAYKDQFAAAVRQDLKVLMAGSLSGGVLVLAYRVARAVRERLKSRRRD
jgi:CelD/BcsL family acetyltransferase involved in cellulose biosynthesis